MPKTSTYIPHFSRNSFAKLPGYEPLSDGVRWSTLGKMIYHDPWGGLIEVPKGFTTDFASIPDLSRIALYVLTFGAVLCLWSFWSLLLVVPAWWVVYIAESFLHEGTWDSQSALHDWMYATRCRTFFQANWILFVSMKGCGAPMTPKWKRCIIFAGVTVGGYFAWVDDARKLNNRDTLFVTQARKKNRN